MLETIYRDVVLAGWVAALILGVCLLLSKVPDVPAYTPYIRSKKILGMAFVVFGILISQFTFFDLRTNNPNIAVALPLSYFYLEAILFGMAFCSLLDRHYIGRRQLLTDFGLYAGFLLLVWGGALLASGVARGMALVGAAVWFFIAASFIAIRFFRIYRRSVRKLDDYYSDNTAFFVKWIHKSTYGIIFLGLCGSVLAFAPRWGNAIFMAAGIAMFVYIYVSFQNYILNYRNVEIAVGEDEPTRSIRPPELIASMTEKIDSWVKAGNYRCQGVTLDNLSKELGINRSYVSSYINSTFKCNFREWINDLRMEYAKTLLSSAESHTIEKISEMSGFSTSAYFCRLFSKREGTTPSKWRERGAR